jgi:hypothetical protein
MPWLRTLTWLFRIFTVAVCWALPEHAQSNPVVGAMTNRDAARILAASAWSRTAESSVASAAITLNGNDTEWTDARNSANAGMNSSANAEQIGTMIQLGGFQQWNPPKLTLRWESSSPVKQALQISGENAVVSPGYYILSATPAPPKKKVGAGYFDLPAIADEMRVDATSAVTLTIVNKTTGRRMLQATRMEKGERGGEPILFFFFPRGQEIEHDDDDVTFEADWHARVSAARFGVPDMKHYLLAVTLKAKFKPKEMTYHGHLEL